MKTNKEKTGIVLLVVVGIVGFIGAILGSPVAQNTAYHNFNDTRLMLNIPNFCNVISNIPFWL